MSLLSTSELCDVDVCERLSKLCDFDVCVWLMWGSVAVLAATAAVMRTVPGVYKYHIAIEYK
jgi:hypothetical protein